VFTELIFDKKVDKFDEEDIRPGKNSFKTGLKWQYNGDKSEPKISSTDYPKGEEMVADWILSGPWSENPVGWFIAGYGPFRYLPSYEPDPYRNKNSPLRINQLTGLFREKISLSDAISWLKDVYLRRMEHRKGARDIEEGIIDLLNDGLLPEGMKVKRVDSEGLWVDLNGKELPLRELSDGYRTVAALVVDLARQLFEAYGEFKIDKQNGNYKVSYPGVVLIDEIDAHLHIHWQQQIGFWLKAHFPGLQFIVTTHSPFICQAADPGGLLRLPAPGEERSVEHVSDDLFNIVINGSVDESLLTELFGLGRQEDSGSNRQSEY
jgi:hypothetical protein